MERTYIKNEKIKKIVKRSIDLGLVFISGPALVPNLHLSFSLDHIGAVNTWGYWSTNYQRTPYFKRQNFPNLQNKYVQRNRPAEICKRISNV